LLPKKLKTGAAAIWVQVADLKQGATHILPQKGGDTHILPELVDQVAALELCVSLRFPAVDSCLAPSDATSSLETGRSQRSGDLGHSQ